ncbi:MAG: hypothetical protein QOE65_1536 [Solirubrobacteraceae bacterium]|nr:hypothetical protein [Solirubrobacteraceae bacterium]
MSEPRDLEASLAEMDRKLRELQRELALVAGGDDPAAEAPAASPPPPAPAPAPDPVARVVEEAAARVSELGRRIDELASLRDDLDRATQALRAEYQATRAAADTSQEVVVDAGPFPDIATLGSFEQALGQVEGVEDAVVRSFEGNRATVDIVLRGGVDLAGALRTELPFAVEVEESQGGGLTLRLTSGA